ncbi:MAG: 2-hydroxyacyl-CoA dehydratase [Bacilli bacterium]|nr:2-hydroxyacyl-CoA dehydratase [Bacilli bacterium]
MSRIKIGFPHVGNYYVPASFLFSHIVDADIICAPSITNKTIDIGVKYSPEFVCTPFKYTLGTLIETIDEGANVLLQLGGGCRYGYYHELQRQIISDLGYDVKYINFVSAGYTDLGNIIKELKKIDSNFSKIKSLYYLIITIRMINYMDKVDHYIRENVGFEINSGEMEKLNNEMLLSFLNVKNIFDLTKKYRYYFKQIKKVKINKPKKIMKIGIIGELYTVMEPFSNYFIEKELSRFGMSITRFTNASYLLFGKKRFMKKRLKKCSYIKYKMGADASDNIIRTIDMCKSGYDGIIHIKSSFCTPEIGSMGIINKICKEYDVPVLFFSFDANTSKVGLQTRLEAFNDMIEMRNV